MTIYEGWELDEALIKSNAAAMNVGISTIHQTLWGKYKRKVEPSPKAKTVKIGMLFNGPYQYLDTSTGEMRQTMPTFTRDDILLQRGLLKHNQLPQSINAGKQSVVTRLIGRISSFL